MPTAVTFEQARTIVEEALRAEWSPELGELYVAPYGFEDARAWQVVAGARESLVDDDPEYDLLDWPLLLVDKATGQLERLPVLEHLERIDGMTPVGDVPDDGELLED